MSNRGECNEDQMVQSGPKEEQVDKTWLEQGIKMFIMSLFLNLLKSSCMDKTTHHTKFNAKDVNVRHFSSHMGTFWMVQEGQEAWRSEMNYNK